MVGRFDIAPPTMANGGSPTVTSGDRNLALQAPVHKGDYPRVRAPQGIQVDTSAECLE